MRSLFLVILILISITFGCIAQLVEHQTFNLNVLGSIPNALKFNWGGVAQFWLEHMFCIHKVIGSSPIVSRYFYIFEKKMRFTNRVRKEILKRKRFTYHHDKVLILKSIFSNQNLPIHLRYRAQMLLVKKYKKDSLSKINRYCLYSSNFRSVSRKFKLSRGFLRDFASRGLIVGLYKQ